MPGEGEARRSRRLRPAEVHSEPALRGKRGFLRFSGRLLFGEFI